MTQHETETKSEHSAPQYIGAVERETGLKIHTLRVWERRYGFPRPLRDRYGRRMYPREQIERLHKIKRLLEHGFRPGKVIGATNALLNRAETDSRVAPTLAPVTAIIHATK